MPETNETTEKKPVPAEGAEDAEVEELATAEDFQYLWDVPVGVTVQLGERRMQIRDILQLRVGSVIGLTKSAGENVDIMINGRIVAFGEVMQLEGSTGIRITELNVHD